jgi:DNA modification methylase
MHEIAIPIDEVAELVGYSPKYIRRLNREGKLKLKRKEGVDHVLWEDVKWLSRHHTPTWSLLNDEMLELEAPPESLRVDSVPQDDFPVNSLQVGSCIDWMKKMPDGLVQTVVTSPPYWGMRRYAGNQSMRWADGEEAEYGVEPYVDGYIQHTTEILRHLKRVLRDDGVVWWNLGDTYVTRAVIRESTVERLDAFEGRRKDTWKDYPFKRYSSGHPYLKDKDLALVPFQVAMAAQRIGFYVRSIIVWSKENTMPEPVKDRPTTSHEYILMLAKSRFYFYNNDVAREPALTEALVRTKNGHDTTDERNLRTVWQFPVSTWQHGAHTAAFPEALPLRCIAATTKPGDLVFDPFVGSGTTAVVANRLNRQFFGCDMSEEYIEIAQNRLSSEQETYTPGSNGAVDIEPVQKTLFESDDFPIDEID